MSAFPQPVPALLLLEAQFIAGRLAPPDLAGAVDAAWRMVPADEHLRKAATAMLKAIVAHATAEPEPPYHDRHHTAEAVRTMAALLHEAQRQGLLGMDSAALGVLAMLGHDLLHDGSAAPRTPSLETIAADRTDFLAAEAGLSPPDRTVLRHVIIGTTRTEVAANAARAAGSMAPTTLGPAADLLRALANEADAAASLAPTLGWRLSDLLAREWRAEAPDHAARVSSCAGRLGFLAQFPCFTAPARALGFGRVRDAQVNAMALAAGAETAAQGAALLDRLPPAEARARLARAVATLL